MSEWKNVVTYPNVDGSRILKVKVDSKLCELIHTKKLAAIRVTYIYTRSSLFAKVELAHPTKHTHPIIASIGTPTHPPSVQPGTNLGNLAPRLGNLASNVGVTVHRKIPSLRPAPPVWESAHLLLPQMNKQVPYAIDGDEGHIPIPPIIHQALKSGILKSLKIKVRKDPSKKSALK